jgi:acyl carrier protein
MLDEQLREAVVEVFGLSSAEVKPESSRKNVSEWDSVGHLRLILTVEDAYGLQFPTAEIPKLTSVGLIQEALDRLRPAVSR